MKKFRLHYGFILVVAMFIASCSSNDYINVISDEAETVVSVDVQSLCKKADLNKDRIQALLGDAYTEITEDLTSKELEIFETLLDNPSDCGIDFATPIYVASQIEYPQMIATMKMSSIKKFEDFINSTDEDNKLEINEGESFNTIIINEGKYGDLRIVFNDDILVYLSGNPKTGDSTIINGMIEEVMNQDASNSIVSTDLFTQMDSQKGDIKYLSLGGSDSANDVIYSMTRSVPYSMRSNVRIALSLIEKTSSVGCLDFKNGEVVCNNRLILDEEQAKIVDEYLDIANGIDGSLNKYLSGDAILYMAMNVNGKKLANYAKQYLGELKRYDVDEEAVMELMKSINGDIASTYALPEGSTLNSNDQDVTIYIEAKNNSIPTFIYEQGKDSKTANEVSKNNYTWKISRRETGYFGYDNSTIYFKTSLGEGEDAVSKQKNSISDSDFASNINGKLIYCAINLYSVFDAMQDDIPISAEVYKKEIDASYVDLSINKDMDYTIRLVFGDSKENSLKKIVDIASELGSILSDM